MRTPMILALLLCTAFAHAGEQKRELPAFNAISSKGAMNMVVQVGQAQSVRITGDDKFIGRVAMKVVGNELVVTIDNQKNVSFKDDARIFVTMPALKSFRAEGAGLAELNNISGDRMEIQFQGAAPGRERQVKCQAECGRRRRCRYRFAGTARQRQFRGIGRVKVMGANGSMPSCRNGRLNYWKSENGEQDGRWNRQCQPV
jgi:hypothetical protein